MNNQQQALPTNGHVSVTDLATEFEKNLRALSKWLLQHDISVGRRAVWCESARQGVASAG